ncbi:MAG: hypothetical protein ACI3XG_04010 [Faecousia sp.]
MKGKKLTRLAAALLLTLLSAGVFGVTASADSGALECKVCAENGLSFTGYTATTEFRKNSETQCARVYQCNNGHKQLTYNADGSCRGVSNHVAVKKATCTEAAVCGNCGSTFGAPLGHSYDEGVVTKPTCFSEGYTIYTCKVCGAKTVTDKVEKLSHWYDLWEPTGDGQNSAPCKRDGCTYIKTTACVDWDFKLVPSGADQAEEYSVCPVCGELNDGGRLELVEEAAVRPITGWTPEGDMVLRCGTLENGEKVICVGFEFDARLVSCTGLTEFTVPAELVEGYALMLLDDQGGETELEVETNASGAAFTLNFYGNAQGKRTPVRMIHLVPIEE